MLDGKSYLYFAGTGYLGLQGDSRVIASAVEAVQTFGVHTATSRAGFGNSPPVLDVEQRAATFLGAEACWYLVSGYACNSAVAAALAHDVDLALVDSAAHDCLREATRWLDGLMCPAIEFRHRDATHLSELLAAHATPASRVLVMTDGIFAASGRIAPLADYLSALEKYDGAMLLVDDAHGLAAVGADGRGTLEWCGVGPERINQWNVSSAAPRVFHTTTLSKAVGGHGGAIAGSATFLERVRSSSGWFRGSSAPAAPVAAATAKALELVASEPWRRERLAANVERVRAGLAQLGIDVQRSPSPVIGFTLAGAGAMQRVHEQLLAAGIAIGFTRDYAGAGPEGMLRIAVFATHTPEMIAELEDVLRRVL